MKNFLRSLLPKTQFLFIMNMYRLSQSIVYCRVSDTHKNDGILIHHNANFIHDIFQAACNIGVKVEQWDKLVSGAIIVSDDYGWSFHIEQKHAFDKFAAGHGVQVLSMPTGQGIIIKP